MSLLKITACACLFAAAALPCAAQQTDEEQIQAMVAPSTRYPNKRQIIIEDLRSLAAIKGSGEASPLHKEIFGGPVDGKVYLEWFNKRIRHIKLRPLLSAVAKNGNWGPSIRIGLKPYHGEPYHGAPKRRDIRLGPEYFWLPKQARMATLIHEARHSDGYLHTKAKILESYDDPMPKPTDCAEGDLQCDETLYGAFGTQMIFLVNAAKYDADYLKNLSEEGRRSLGYYTVDLFVNIVNPDDRNKLIEDLFKDSAIVISHKKIKKIVTARRSEVPPS